MVAFLEPELDMQRETLNEEVARSDKRPRKAGLGKFRAMDRQARSARFSEIEAAELD